jgi:hypothetical protein
MGDISLVQGRYKWRTLVNAVMKFHVHKVQGILTQPVVLDLQESFDNYETVCSVRSPQF